MVQQHKYILIGFCIVFCCLCQTEQTIDARIDTVTPNKGYFDKEVAIEISGQNFEPLVIRELSCGNPDFVVKDDFSASLDNIALQDVTWIDSNTIVATVPSGLDPGIYDLEILDPFDNKIVAQNAYEVLSADTDTDSGTETDSGTDTDICDVSFSETFAEDDGGFTPSTGTWQWGNPTTSEPVLTTSDSLWGTNLLGDYGTCDNDFLTSPEIDLSACAGESFNLTFDIWYDYVGRGGDWDGLTVELWMGGEWVMVAPTGGWESEAIGAHNDCDPSNLPYIDGLPGFTGDGRQWATKTINFVNAAAPAEFKFRFVHGSDGPEYRQGAYIRNVALEPQ